MYNHLKLKKMNFDSLENFEWDLPNGLSINSKIKSPAGSKIYCHEPYAEELAKLYFTSNDKFDGGSKDLTDGGVYPCTIISVKADEALAQTNSGQTIYIDLKRERRDAEKLNITGIGFYPGEELKARVRKINGSYSGSIIEYYIHSLRVELFEQIKKESNAYLVKIVSINKGGYIAELSGIKCFMPGSLAAANKITDFESYIGKEMHVMIEGYVEAKDIFIVSYKKYLNRIMDSKIQELDLTKKYRGYVTGTSDFGVFVEWDDVYTGLIHKTEFAEGNSLAALSPGIEIEFYVKEIKDNNRLTLTLDQPLERNVIIQDLESQVNEGTVEPMEAKVKHKRKNGALVELQELGLLALIPQDKLGKRGNNIRVGDDVTVIPYEVETISGKIYVKVVDVG
jgi:ribosomal protein S1